VSEGGGTSATEKTAQGGEKDDEHVLYGKVRRWVSLFSRRIAVAKEIDQ
jgi:hypothetical protein